MEILETVNSLLRIHQSAIDKMRFLLFIFLPCSAFAFWLDADYLAWFIKKNPVPVPLVTFASEADDLPGAIGQPNTRILLGKESFGMGWMQGFEVHAGSWISCGMGIEAGYLFLPTVTKKRSVTTSGEPGSPNLAVPIFDVTGVFGLNGIPGETIYVLPGPLEGSPFFSGVFKLNLSSKFQGAELNGLCSFPIHPQFSLDWLWGFRWFELKESLRMKSITITVPNTPFSQNASQFSDRFHTTNDYLAGQLGLKGEFYCGWWRLKGVIKGSVGTSLEKLKIQGSSSTITGTVWFNTSGTAGETIPGGIFAQPSNIGSHRKPFFAYSVETRVNSIFEITKNWSIDLGYSFLWISKVLRPGNQIDRKINSTRTALADVSRATTGTGPGPIPFGTPGSAPAAVGITAPKVFFRESSFWAQGLNAGISFNY